MATRRTLGIVSASLATATLFFGCTVDTRYRVLSFFFDGVPRPGAAAEAEGGGRQRGTVAATQTEPDQVVAAEKYFTHTAYAQNRCGTCHNKQTARLFRTPREGLCQMCHTDPPGTAPYLHGPVAVNACLMCHHPHVAPYPGVTMRDLPELCFQCHESEDLTSGPHHETAGQSRCTVCHSPHGGGDRFFLKRMEP